MAVTLALLEATALFMTAFGAIVLWGQPVPADWIQVTGLLGQALALSFCCILTFYFNDLYDLRVVRSIGEFAPRLVQSVGIVFILVLSFYALFPRSRIAEQPLVSTLLLVIGLLVAIRAASYSAVQTQPFVERVLLIGASPLTIKLIEEIEAQPHHRYTIVGVADDAATSAEPPPRYPLLGPLKYLPKIVEEVRPDRIVIGLTEWRGRLPIPQLLECRARGTFVQDGARFYERLTGKLAIESLMPSAVILGEFRPSRLEHAIRRGVNLIVAAAGLIALAPVFGLIALAIRLDSRGPVFFVQERVGLHGRRFPLLKFRTMHPASGSTSEWVRDNEDRITRVGKWLRRFRLDEIPQLVNILRGEMSLVGPRPHPASNFALFSERIPYYSLRATVRPGVSGWAQLRYGYANDLSEETEKMRYDLYYITHRSLWLDLRIVFDTARIVLFGRDAR
jgi:exopolysaccharide biosynthesis polyprenyl glycosylphosphotransferase